MKYSIFFKGNNLAQSAIISFCTQVIGSLFFHVRENSVYKFSILVSFLLIRASKARNPSSKAWSSLKNESHHLPYFFVGLRFSVTCLIVKWYLCFNNDNDTHLNSLQKGWLNSHKVPTHSVLLGKDIRRVISFIIWNVALIIDALEQYKKHVNVSVYYFR